MAKKSSGRKKSSVKRRVNKSCPFCGSSKEPEYKDFEGLSRYLSDRSKILGRERTGVCSKHQRRLTREIKRARHLGLLPFVSKI